MANKKKSVADASVAIEYLPLSQLARWPRNPKQHDGVRIRNSIQRHGFVAPLIQDGKTSRLVAGHGRLEALLHLKAENAEPPARIRVEGKEWLVPVVTGVSFPSEREAEDYLLEDNRLVELGGWDTEALVEILKEGRTAEDVSALGWSENELRRMVSELESTELRGSKPADLLEGFNAGVIKQIVLYFKTEEFETVLTRLEAVMARERVENHTEAFLKLLEVYERANDTKAKKAS